MKSSSLYFYIALSFGLLLSYMPVSATHFMGVDITYECMNNCIYRVYHSTYYDCTGSAVSGNVPVSTSPAPTSPSNFNFTIDGIPNTPGQNCNDPVAVGNWVLISWTEVTPICPTAETQCENPNAAINGAAEARYYRDYDFCNTNCDVYTLEWETCCRNGDITSLNNPLSQGIYTGATQINTSISPCNSSPQFSNPPVPYLCEGQAFTFNQGAFDPDGDSLVYSLGPCFADPGVQVNYNVAQMYSPTQPLGPGWMVSINSFTGDITITPNPTGPTVVGVMCVVVEEYRNGVKIGQVVRDIQITVVPASICNALGQNTSPVITQLTNLSPGATANGLVVDACACDEVCFDIPVMDADTGQTYTLYWNANLPGTFANALSPFIPVDTIVSANVTPTGQFCWVPTVTGTYQFLVTVTDDGCPIIGLNQYSIVINVNSCSLDPFASTNKVGCFDIEFDGIPCGGAPPFNYTWTGTGGLNGTGKTLVHNYPGPGTYNYTLTITDSTGATSSTSGSLSLSNTSMADGGPDKGLCPGEVGTIGTPALPGYTYQWSSSNGLGWAGTPNPSTAEASVAFNNGTNQTLCIQYYIAATDPTGCTAIDTVEVCYSPKPPSNFNVTNTVCVNSPATAVYAAPQVPGSNFTWTYGGGGVGTTIGPGPHNVTWNTPGIKEVKLSVDVNGCVSDTTTKLVKVNGIPTANFSATSQVCAGQPALLTYTGSADPMGNTQFIWDLDGGSGSGGAGPFGVIWPTPGTKTISLTVVENGCISPTVTQTVQVFKVPTSSFSVPSSVCEGSPVQIVYTGDGGAGAAFAWNFDGGQVLSGTGIGPYTVFWATPGPKNITLQVEENGCISSQTSQTIDVLAEPSAGIAPVANQCFMGNSFSFTYSGDGNVNSYSWNFGPDATPPTSSSGTPGAVSYQNIGLKTVSLVVTRSGCVSDSVKVNFEVVPEPSADFQLSSAGVCNDSCITYDYVGVVVGPNQSYSWDFGLGAIPSGSSLPNPGCVAYTVDGAKTVSLSVSYKGCTTTSTQNVQINGRPSVSAGPDIEFCEGDGGAQFAATVSGGTTPYFYDWSCDDPPNCGLSSNSILNPVANPNTALTPTDSIRYYLRVVDMNGCESNLDSAWVVVKAKPVMDAGPDVSICSDGPGDFLLGGVALNNNAPEPITYQWFPAIGLNNPNAQNPFARPDTTTIYTLVGNSSNGCSSEVNTLDTLSTVTVVVNAKPFANAGRDTALCEGETIQLQGFASGAGPAYSYRWTPATPGTIDDATSATPNITPPFTTTYSLVVTSNGCDSDADQVEVLVDTRPTVSSGNDETICLRDSVQLDGSASGDPNASNYRYQWFPSTGLSNPNVGKPLASPMMTTVYKVLAESNFGCGSDSAEILVTVEPTPEVEALSADTLICEGDTISLSATHSFTTPSGGPVVYEWTPRGSILGSPSLANVEIAPTTTTLYLVQTSIAGDCPTQDQVLVTVSPKVEASVSADTTRICADDFAQLLATGGLGNATYSWSPPLGLSDPSDPNPQASPDTTTRYVVLISEGACSDTASIDIDVNPRPTADYFSSQAQGCVGIEVSFLENSENAIGFRWDFGDGSAVSNETNPSHVYNQPGNYVVTLTTIGIGGCEASSSRTTVSVSDASFADFSSTPVSDSDLALPNAQVDFSDLSARALSWLWDFGDGTISTEQNPSHQYSEPGSYTVRLSVTDDNGCVSTVEYGEYRVFAPDLLIPNVFSPNGDGINDGFRVRYTGDEQFSLAVFDRWGRKFFSADAVDKPWPGTDEEGNPAQEGVYYYTLIIGGKSYTGNITLMR